MVAADGLVSVQTDGPSLAGAGDSKSVKHSHHITVHLMSPNGSQYMNPGSGRMEPSHNRDEAFTAVACETGLMPLMLSIQAALFTVQVPRCHGSEYPCRFYRLPPLENNIH